MRQKVFVAMALTQDTDYILMDEPTTYLDISHQLELMSTLRALADEGRGILTVMHDLPLAFAFSDRVALLHEGRIAFCGTPDELCATDLIERIFGVTVCHDGGSYYYQY
jgi:iron complex transport system ATP-binding protein